MRPAVQSSVVARAAHLRATVDLMLHGLPSALARPELAPVPCAHDGRGRSLPLQQCAKRWRDCDDRCDGCPVGRDRSWRYSELTGVVTAAGPPSGVGPKARAEIAYGDQSDGGEGEGEGEGEGDAEGEGEGDNEPWQSVAAAVLSTRALVAGTTMTATTATTATEAIMEATAKVATAPQPQPHPHPEGEGEGEARFVDLLCLRPTCGRARKPGNLYCSVPCSGKDRQRLLKLPEQERAALQARREQELQAWHAALALPEKQPEKGEGEGETAAPPKAREKIEPEIEATTPKAATQPLLCLRPECRGARKPGKLYCSSGCAARDRQRFLALSEDEQHAIRVQQAQELDTTRATVNPSPLRIQLDAVRRQAQRAEQQTKAAESRAADALEAQAVAEARAEEAERQIADRDQLAIEVHQLRADLATVQGERDGYRAECERLRKGDPAPASAALPDPEHLPASYAIRVYRYLEAFISGSALLPGRALEEGASR